ncbi:hypothetical protein SELMODRAFT_410747 [Selaginella moellendorffii]|uniref:CN hydrolase domain-containing protein n=1 Tax=Selaginella moellendorffii TaxID=88036 RepID=D8RFR3_SELML|nr:hypothetical protein SELMODRAFT_410747 [Selaginella moellendorffii]
MPTTILSRTVPIGLPSDSNQVCNLVKPYVKPDKGSSIKVLELQRMVGENFCSLRICGYEDLEAPVRDVALDGVTSHSISNSIGRFKQLECDAFFVQASCSRETSMACSNTTSTSGGETTRSNGDVLSCDHRACRSKFKLAVCHLSIYADKEQNIRHAREAIQTAADGGSKLILLLEMGNCPYSNASFPIYAGDSPSSKMLSDMAKTLFHTRFTFFDIDIPYSSKNRTHWGLAISILLLIRVRNCKAAWKAEKRANSWWTLFKYFVVAAGLVSGAFDLRTVIDMLKRTPKLSDRTRFTLIVDAAIKDIVNLKQLFQSEPRYRPLIGDMVVIPLVPCECSDSAGGALRAVDPAGATAAQQSV